jgi:RNA polymerase sigma factor (sigma-70 family)
MERPTDEYLYERFGKVAGYAALAYVKSNSWLAQDLMSAADMAIFVAADGFDWEASEDCYGFAAYLKIIVREECNSLLAANAYATSGPRGVLGKDVLHGWGSMDEHDYSQGFEWDDASDAESLDTIREVAERVLTARQYEAFARYYFDGICSDTHVAELMGVNRPAVQKLRVRAEERISEELENMELL